MKEIELAGLTVRLAGGTDCEGGGDGPLVVLLHGFGAPGDDLASLWRVVDAPRGTRWAFPAGPEAVPIEPGRRAWWFIDIERRLLAAERGELESLSREVPLGMTEARARVTALLDEIDARLKPSKLVLGGFSQGAMLACDVALRSERALAGIALLSGTLLAADEVGAARGRAPRSARLPEPRHRLSNLAVRVRREAPRPAARRRAGRDMGPISRRSRDPQAVLVALGRWVQAVLR